MTRLNLLALLVIVSGAATLARPAPAFAGEPLYCCSDGTVRCCGPAGCTISKGICSAFA